VLIERSITQFKVR